MKQKKKNSYGGILGGLTIGLIGLLFVLPPIAQDLHYHGFADQKQLFGIPNFMNVFSNIPFICIGMIGIIRSMRMNNASFPKIGLLCFFIGIFLTGFGSAYYHWHPDNASLLWDRLPMTIAFMSLLSMVVSLHIDAALGKKLLYPLISVGIGSVLYWYVGELHQSGDLRPYIGVQFYPMLFIPLIMFLYPLKGAVRTLLLPIIGCYAVAKYFEYGDEQMYALSNILSGHTLKHLFAALATIPVLSFHKFYQSIIIKNEYGKSSNEYL